MVNAVSPGPGCWSELRTRRHEPRSVTRLRAASMLAGASSELLCGLIEAVKGDTLEVVTDAREQKTTTWKPSIA